MGLFADIERFTVEDVHTNGVAVALFGKVDGVPCLVAANWAAHGGNVCILRNGVSVFIPMTDNVRREIRGYAPSWRG